MNESQLRRFGQPTWLSINVPQGVNLSEQFKAALNKEHGILTDWHELQKSMRMEPALFLRVDLRDLRDASGAKILKGFLESNTKPERPTRQQRTAVLCCSLEEMEKHSGIFANLFASGVKWEIRDE